MAKDKSKDHVMLWGEFVDALSKIVPKNYELTSKMRVIIDPQNSTVSLEKVNEL